VTSPATPPEPKVLRDGRYALLRKLGEGSQGETYEAMDHGVGPEARARAARKAPLSDKWSRYVREQKSGGEVPQDARLVAIKCFRVGSAKSWKDVELAEREARTLASLDHPRLPRYFEHFEEGGALYLVMEKIEGESLAAIRKNGRAMSAADVTRMLEDIGEALRYLHGRAPFVVHRDIKPGNVLRRLDGSFALVDFGAVRDRLKPAGGSTVVGTFGFMAPEQFQGRASPGSDVYGLGATAITMLTGVDPEELPHVGLGIDVTRALPKSTPAPLARALAAMLIPDPDRRAGSIDEALALLRDDAPANRAEEAPPPAQVTHAERAPRRATRRPLRFVDLAAIASVWSAVFVMTRPGMGHHPGRAAFAIVFALLVTMYLRRPRRAARRSPKVRVAEEPARVRAAVDAAPDEVEDADDATHDQSDAPPSRRARKARGR
jgi:serine/threonine protein kinase